MSRDKDLEFDDDYDLDVLAAINRALSSMGMTNLTHLNHSNNERCRRNNSRRIQQGNLRKTRLSWELHPILIDALDDDNNGTHRIADDGDEGDGDDESTTERQASRLVQHQDHEERKEEE